MNIPTQSVPASLLVSVDVSDVDSVIDTRNPICETQGMTKIENQSKSVLNERYLNVNRY